MFSYRRDKTGFFATLILLVIVLGVVVTTTVLIVVGVAVRGDWKAYLLAWKWVMAGCWIGCIVTVLVRVIIFRQQMLRAEQRALEESKREDGGDVVRQE